MALTMWKVTDSPMWSLGMFIPTSELLSRPATGNSNGTKGSVWQEWYTFIHERIKNVAHQIEVRDPAHYWSLQSANDGLDRDGSAKRWHRDGDSDCVADLPEYLAMWSNEIGTEIKFRGVVYQAPPGEVLLIDNHLMMHRSPPWKRARIDVSNRWFARALCSSKCLIKDVPGIFTLDL